WYRFPGREVTDGLESRAQFNIPDSLIPADVGYHLHVVMVLQSGRNSRLNVPAVFCISLVDKQSPVRITLSPFSGHPFIPAGNKDKGYVLRNGKIPLLLNVVTI